MGVLGALTLARSIQSKHDTEAHYTWSTHQGGKGEKKSQQAINQQHVLALANT
jgi:hypothetical protein